MDPSYVLNTVNATKCLLKRALFCLLQTNPVILLQIVMVSTGTHLVKNHESQSRAIESQLKNNESLGLL